MATVFNITRRAALKLFTSAGAVIALPATAALAARATGLEAAAAWSFEGEGWYLNSSGMGIEHPYYISAAKEIPGSTVLWHEMTARDGLQVPHYKTVYFIKDRIPECLGRKITDAEALAFEAQEWNWYGPRQSFSLA